MPNHDDEDEERRALEESDTLRLIPIYDEDRESAASDRPAMQPLPDRPGDRDAVVFWPSGAQHLALTPLS